VPVAIETAEAVKTKSDLLIMVWGREWFVFVVRVGQDVEAERVQGRQWLDPA
jgi:hypothetical protein